MRKKLLLLIFSLFCTISHSLAQISISTSNTSIERVIEMIEQKSDYGFFYSGELPALKEKVSVNFENSPIKEVLDELFSGVDIEYNIVSNNQITLSKRDKEEATKSPKSKGSNPIQGVVVDAQGEPLIGATVVLSDGVTGATTDINGGFSIDTKEPNQVISVSFLGYTTQDVNVGTSSNLTITLKSDQTILDEVVVVGYGTQKRVNLTGSVSMAGAEELESRPITNVENGLQGLLPGVTVVSASGQPGADNTSIRVRGVGTLGNANPLVLIDGVEGDMSTLNPEDIESVSVLKDAASAAIYGARAANGVLLITTKNPATGEQATSVNIGLYYGWQTPTSLPEMLDAVTFMNLDNEARLNVGAPAAWLPEQIKEVEDNSNPNYFGNTNWLDVILKDYAPQLNANVTINGTLGANNGYVLSYRHLDQSGLTQGNSTGEKRHNIRFKLNNQLLKRVTLSSNLSYSARGITAPAGGLSSQSGIIYSAMRTAPNAPVYYTDGSWAYGGGNTNPLAVLTDGGESTLDNNEFSLSEVVKLEILKGWDITGTYNLTSTNSLQSVLKKTIEFVNPETNALEYTYGSPNSLSNKDIRQLQQTLIVQSNFNFDIGKHNISGVAGMSQEWLVSRMFEASRTSLVTDKDPTLNFGSSASMSNDAAASQWALRSGFGRINYNYDDRYLLEANLRYDLSSRFHKDYRGGLFPSFSGAWRLSEESFMSFSRDLFDNIKIRASWGKLGNQYVGSSNYPYLSIIEEYSGLMSLIGAQAVDGYMQSTLSNPNLTWETITMTNLGLDLSLLRNRLSMTFDWYNKDTEGILLQLNYPSQIGANVSEQNAGAVNNKGWEMTINWQDNIGEFKYGASFNISDVKNKITKLSSSPDLSGMQIRREGDPIDAFYGYVADGLMTPEDFDIYDEYNKTYMSPNVPVALGYTYQPGDIKYVDLSGPDGKPDGRITPEHDKQVIGSQIPRYTYNINANAEWRGIDFSATLQGVGKCDGLLLGSARHAFNDMAAYPQKQHLDRYHITENPDPNASYPRFTYNTTFNQKTMSTYWIEDASYLRIKSIIVGYTLPREMTQKWSIDNLRVYASLDNWFTFSDFYEAYDPETPVSYGGYYPQVKTFAMGINIRFK